MSLIASDDSIIYNLINTMNGDMNKNAVINMISNICVLCSFILKLLLPRKGNKKSIKARKSKTSLKLGKFHYKRESISYEKS